MQIDGFNDQDEFKKQIDSDIRFQKDSRPSQYEQPANPPGDD